MIPADFEIFFDVFPHVADFDVEFAFSGGDRITGENPADLFYAANYLLAEAADIIGNRMLVIVHFCVSAIHLVIRSVAHTNILGEKPIVYEAGWDACFYIRDQPRPSCVKRSVFARRNGSVRIGQVYL